MDTQEVIEAIIGGTSVYKCSNCDEIFEQGDLVQVRECSNDQCSEIFNGTEGRNCSSCNRPFSRILTEKGCPDCLEEDECDEITTKDLDTAEIEENELWSLFEEAQESETNNIAPVFTTKTDHIRYLASKGLSRTAIASELGVSYQQVRSALISKSKARK